MLQRKKPQTVKDQISQKLTGRKLSDEHKANISKAMKDAWSKVPKTTTDIWAENNTKNTNENDKKRLCFKH